MHKYGYRDSANEHFSSVKAVSKEQLAERLNISVDKIEVIEPALGVSLDTDEGMIPKFSVNVSEVMTHLDSIVKTETESVVDVVSTLSKDLKDIDKTAEEAQKQQEDAEEVRLEQELAKAELECKDASAEWNEWSAGIGRNAPYNDPNNPERIKRDKECQDTWKKVSELKEEIKTQKAETDKKAAEDTAKQQQEQADAEKVKLEQEAKQKSEDEAQQAKADEETKKAAEKAEADKKAVEEAEKVKLKQEATAKQQQEAQAAAAEAQNQQAEADKAKQEQEAKAQEEETAKQAEETQKAETDKKSAEDAAKAQEADQSQADKKVFTKEELEQEDREFAEALAQDAKDEEQELAEGEQLRKTQQEQAAEEAQKQQISLAEMGEKQIQEMKNFGKYNKLSREGVEVTPNMDSNELDRAESQHDQTEQLRKTQQEQTDNYAADFQHRITEPNKFIGLPSDNTSLSHHAIGTGSRPNNQGHLEFTPCDSNPDAYVGEPNTGVNLIGTDQTHTD
jgi:hypothetical protein